MVRLARRAIVGVKGICSPVEKRWYQGRVSLMEHRREVKAQGYDPTTSGSRPDVNGTAASIALLDFEERKRREVDEHYRWIEAASKACFGPDERGGGELCAPAPSAA